MTALVYLLAKNPQHIDKLREELKPLVPDENAEYSSDSLAHLNHLNGVINEALRLYPPVPTAIYRKTPSEGITIDGTYIPGDMNIFCSQYALGRSKFVFPNWRQSSLITVFRPLGESMYSRPNDFIPERWYSAPEMVKCKAAFAPFSLGSSCIMTAICES